MKMKTSRLLATALALAATHSALPVSAAETAAKRYNVVLIIRDQEQGSLLAAPGYKLPALDTLAARGVVFRQHYIASAMCSPSRAAFLTGLPPQRNGVFDQMEETYTPSLDPAIPTMGTKFRQLGYTTAYFGKFEMLKEILKVNGAVNYSTALRPFGFDVFSAHGDTGSEPNSGYDNDTLIAGEAVQWLRKEGLESKPGDKPFLMVASFINPHDIMCADVNPPGETVQKSLVPGQMTTPPDNAIYRKQWDFKLPKSLGEKLDAPGMPSALAEYQRGWAGTLGEIPTDRPDMWKRFNNYYLNMIRDSDRTLQQIVDVLNEQDLWKNTIVILTADHGEMGGAHGGLSGKGPMAYEQNAHVPFIVVHPDFPPGTTDALTSHLDLLPTLIGMSGAPEPERRKAAAGLPGHDASVALQPKMRKNVHAVRPGVLFNYVGPLTLDAGFCVSTLTKGSGGGNLATLKPQLGKRGFLSFTYDGRYKFARFYAPNDFNAPKTLDELFAHNDVQLFDLENDPEEMNNLALDRVKNAATLERMNALLNDLMAKEVGVNDGSFLPEAIRPAGVAPLKRP